MKNIFPGSNSPITLPLKVCQVASSDITLRYMLFGQMKFLKSLGYQVHGVSSPGPRISEIEQVGIKIKAIPIKRKISPLSDIITFVRLFLYFRRERFDIVHVHTLKPELYGQIAARLTGVHIILNTLHGFDFAQGDPAFKKKIIILIQKIAALFSTHIFSISRSIIKDAIKYKIAKSELFSYIGRDIDTQRFNPANFSEGFITQEKRLLKIPQDYIVLGIVGRLVAEKGFLELFAALSSIVKNFPRIVLLVVGPGEPEKKDGFGQEAFKKYGILDHVIFLGERTDMEKLYSLMDIFVLPTHREGLGAAILEASAMGKPVIASMVGGCGEAIDEGKTGILVPPKDAHALEGAIMRLVNDPEMRKKMGAAGRSKVVNEFSEEIVFQRLKYSYEKFIKERLPLP